MPLRPVYGHEPLLRRLGSAIASGRFPQAVLFIGPHGVGKQRLALWAAQGLLCDRNGASPCGKCQPCLQVLGLNHPDLHWFVPIVRPKAADTDKQAEEVAAQLADVLTERRANPLYGSYEPMASHPLASVRLLQRRVALKPFQGPRQVVVLGNAERLIVQEASQEAANAMLKVLEEPPATTYLIVTTAEVHTLLPTIRSRLVPLRVGGVGDKAVRSFLEREVDPPLKGATLDQRVLLAQGAIGRAISATGSQAPDTKAADRLLAAVRQGPGRWAGAALAQAPWSARGEFTAALDGLALRMRDAAAEDATGGSATLARRVDAIRSIERIREEAQGNANPQLALAVLSQELEGSL